MVYSVATYWLKHLSRAMSKVQPANGNTKATPQHGKTSAITSRQVRTTPLRRPLISWLTGLLHMHTGSFMDLCSEDFQDDQDRIQRFCDQMALASGLRLSFTYGSVQDANSNFLAVETNSPGVGFAYVILATLASVFDYCVVVASIVTATVLTMVSSEHQFLYIAICCRSL